MSIGRGSGDDGRGSTLRVETVPVLGDNYAYLLVVEESGEAVAIDPAQATPVARRLEQQGLRLCAIWCTHHHGDHTGGIPQLLREVASCPVVGHASDRGRIPGLTEAVEQGAVLTVGQGRREVTVLHTPGHTRGAVCYHVDGDLPLLFTGDTLFAAGCGRLFEGDARTMFHSLQQIQALDPRTQIYCGHEYTLKNLDFAWQMEPDNSHLARRIEQVQASREQGAPSVPFTLAQELQTSPFLRCDAPGIIETLTRRHGLQGTSPLEVFTRLRELRNGF